MNPVPLPDDFEPLDLLSRGNSFEVWDCWDHSRYCRVTVKCPRPDRVSDQATVARLKAEGSLLAELTHPHILRSYGFSAEPSPHLVLETLGGESLAHTIDETGTLAPEEIGHLGLQLGSALAYLHARGYVHLDVKSSNVIGEAGRARLIDLGLSIPFGDGTPGAGTWSYMAPEQVSGIGLGPPADVWGLGAVMFESLCGHPPFDPTGEGDETGTRETSTGIGPEPDRYPQLEGRAILAGDRIGESPQLEDLILDCLEPASASRPAISEVIFRLESLVGYSEGERHQSRSIA